MSIPKHIGVYDIQASIFGLHNKVLPHLQQNPFHKNIEMPQISTNEPPFLDENQRKYYVLQECFWDSGWSRRWGFSFGHWWWWPSYRRWHCTGSAQNQETRPWRARLGAWKPSEFPCLSSLSNRAGGNLKMQLLNGEMYVGTRVGEKLWASDPLLLLLLCSRGNCCTSLLPTLLNITLSAQMHCTSEFNIFFLKKYQSK